MPFFADKNSAIQNEFKKSLPEKTRQNKIDSSFSRISLPNFKVCLHFRKLVKLKGFHDFFMVLQFTKFWRFSSDDFKVTLPKKLVKLKGFHEFVKVWRFFLRHFSWNQRKFSQFFSPLFSRFIYVANKLVKLKGFPGFVYILQKFDEFFVTFFVKPKEVCIFTNFLCRFSRFIYIAKKFVKLKDFPDLFTFWKVWRFFFVTFLVRPKEV